MHVTDFDRDNQLSRPTTHVDSTPSDFNTVATNTPIFSVTVNDEVLA